MKNQIKSPDKKARKNIEKALKKLGLKQEAIVVERKGALNVCPDK